MINAGIASLLATMSPTVKAYERTDQYSRQLRFEESDTFIILQLSDIMMDDNAEDYLKT